jgi:hypothetical protein
MLHLCVNRIFRPATKFTPLTRVAVANVPQLKMARQRNKPGFSGQFNLLASVVRPVTFCIEQQPTRAVQRHTPNHF